ncbi:2-C-methyl-D-erythritol 4-phosphate cytidylyltransferase [uncultured Alistipes sp.]|uniref:IspD/TarI family cytidylyltransferase n=1 Tax=uncultured Alistipes sp. TaxID=538949 RepID=UPI002609A173|nr:2-C-methyl-D-erythritol 4-phosphate cytidylyltransferase [uncultured Alistipes sp.]
MHTGVIIVAGGSGRRVGGSIPKQFRLLGGMPVLARTINRFAEALPGAEIVVVLPGEHIAFWRDLAARFDVAKHSVAAGGSERFHSVKHGIDALKSDPELIAVQDGVRPLASPEMIRGVVRCAELHGAAIPVVEPVDSFRETEEEAEEGKEGRNGNGACAGDDTASAAAGSHIVDRRRLRIVQTPQVFRAEWLRGAYALPYRETFTDDASVVEAAGHAIRLASGERENIKITTPADFLIAEALIAAREEADNEFPE